MAGVSNTGERMKLYPDYSLEDLETETRRRINDAVLSDDPKDHQRAQKLMKRLLRIKKVQERTNSRNPIILIKEIASMNRPSDIYQEPYQEAYRSALTGVLARSQWIRLLKEWLLAGALILILLLIMKLLFYWGWL